MKDRKSLQLHRETLKTLTGPSIDRIVGAGFDGPDAGTGDTNPPPPNTQIPTSCTITITVTLPICTDLTFIDCPSACGNCASNTCPITIGA